MLYPAIPSTYPIKEYHIGQNACVFIPCVVLFLCKYTKIKKPIDICKIYRYNISERYIEER